MTGTVLPFRRPSRPTPHAAPCAVTLCAAHGDVVLGVDNVELELTPEQARELARDLVELASDAEAGRG